MHQPPNPDFRLIALPSLFIQHGRIDRYLPPGSTISEYMRRIGWDPKTMHARVSIDGRFIESAMWEHTMPKAGQSVVMRCVPGVGGGGGGAGGKSTMQIVAMLGVVALAFAAPYLAPALAGALMGGGAWAGAISAVGFGTIGGTLLTAGVGIGGMLAVSALIPAPLPRRARALPIPRPTPSLPVAA
jgi:hypothetical protein